MRRIELEQDILGYVEELVYDAKRMRVDNDCSYKKLRVSLDYDLVKVGGKVDGYLKLFDNFPLSNHEKLLVEQILVLPFETLRKKYQNNGKNIEEIIQNFKCQIAENHQELIPFDSVYYIKNTKNKKEQSNG